VDASCTQTQQYVGRLDFHDFLLTICVRAECDDDEFVVIPTLKMALCTATMLGELDDASLRHALMNLPDATFFGKPFTLRQCTLGSFPFLESSATKLFRNDFLQSAACVERVKERLRVRAIFPGSSGMAPVNRNRFAEMSSCRVAIPRVARVATIPTLR
jgi:hypothetical protein